MVTGVARYDKFQASYGEPVRRDESLAAYTTFRTGGPADLYVEVASTMKLVEAIRLAVELAIPYFVIGEGSNLLVSDDGYRGLIIRNQIMGLAVENRELVAGAGERLDRAVDYATEHSLTGLEFAAGIWGTVGGAVCGNAGASGSQMSSVLDRAELVDRQGNIRIEPLTYFEFAYRYSRLKQTGETVSRSWFCLESGSRIDIARRTEEIRLSRCQKHPVQPCSAGCFFRNIENLDQPNGKLSAGKLLDEVGAKRLRVGAAAVFDRHANILINAGGASSRDIRQLADILKARVKERFNVDLQEEVICLGNF